jgi:uncharacterized damage-inducible protein DinB
LEKSFTFSDKSTQMKLFVGLLLSLFIISAKSQTPLNETLKQQLVKDWERAKSYTQEYLDVMPADKYGFRPVDSIRSFGEQMLHLAQGNAGLVAFGTGAQNATIRSLFFKPNFEKTPVAQNKDSVVTYVKASYDFVIDAIKNFDFSKSSEVVTQDLPGGKRSAERLVWLLKAFEHQTHHRGQCTIYLRLLGIRPPAEKLW